MPRGLIVLSLCLIFVLLMLDDSIPVISHMRHLHDTNYVKSSKSIGSVKSEGVSSCVRLSRSICGGKMRF